MRRICLITFTELHETHHLSKCSTSNRGLQQYDVYVLYPSLNFMKLITSANFQLSTEVFKNTTYTSYMFFELHTINLLSKFPTFNKCLQQYDVYVLHSLLNFMKLTTSANFQFSTEVFNNTTVR